MYKVSFFLHSYLRHLPPGVDPLTYKRNEVAERLRQTAVFPLFSMPNPTSMNLPLMGPTGLVGVQVHEKLHRFDIRVKPEGRKGFRTNNRVATQQVAEIQMKWRPIADNYVASPNLTPPPRRFRPQHSQRFVMQDGIFRFLDGQGSGLRGFGCGRTFPIVFGGRPLIQIGAVIDLMKGIGGFAGREGLVIVTGTVDPPASMSLSILPVITDYDGSLQARSALSPVDRLPNPDPRSTFFVFYGETDPQHMARVIPFGNQMFATTRTRLRLVRVELDIDEQVKSCRKVGKGVGHVHADFWFGPFSGTFPIPFQCTDGRLDFHDRGGKPIGSLRADIVEGRAFLNDVPGVLLPVFSGAGIAPIIEGTGVFEGATGFVSAVARLSLYPRAMSVFYIVRINDPDRRYCKASGRAWH